MTKESLDRIDSIGYRIGIDSEEGWQKRMECYADLQCRLLFDIKEKLEEIDQRVMKIEGNTSAMYGKL